MNKSFILLVFVLVVSTFSFAQTAPSKSDGNELLHRCGELIQQADSSFTTSNTFGSTWCLGYIEGFLGGFEALAITGSKSFAEYQELRESAFCIPDDVTLGQDARVLVKYLKDHPERLHEQESTLLTAALREAFPCPVPPPQVHKSAKSK